MKTCRGKKDMGEKMAWSQRMRGCSWRWDRQLELEGTACGIRLSLETWSHGRQGYFSPLENMPKMIWNVFMFFGPFSVGKIGIGNFSFCVTNYVRSMENITDPKTLIKHCNFSPFLRTKEAQRTKHVHEIFKHNKCNIS